MRVSAAIAARGGIGLKACHWRAMLEQKPDLGFVEIQAENYMGAGGPPHHYLTRIRGHYPLSLHGVGLSIGGAAPLSKDHLARLKTLIARYEPGLFSEHLAWSTHEDAYLPDLLPLPYTRSTLDRVVRHIDETQEALGRQLLLENPSTYVTFPESEMAETAFIAEIRRRTGCLLLLDVNNVFVSARNQGFDPYAYVDAYPLSHVREIHLAGHDVREKEALLIDAHASPVADDVWALYAHVIGKTGPVPTLIERDGDVPALVDLVAEAHKADTILAESARAAA
jgi:uncharacterized protein (UPF0276 family)